MEPAVDQGGGWPPLRRLRGHLQQHGHVAVPLPAVAAARASELLLTVPTLLRDAAHVQALDALAADWAATTDGRHLLSWGARQPQDPRGGKCHLQTTGDFDRFATADPRAPALLRAVLARLRCFGAAADRMLAGFAAPLHTTVRANVYACDGGVPTHVDESALTVLFTDRPGSLLVAAGGRRAPLRPVRGDGWHAVVLPGRAAGRLWPDLAPSPHAATPPVDGPRLSISVFATVEHSAPAHGGRGRSALVG
jgi:hypothetical protein